METLRNFVKTDDNPGKSGKMEGTQPREKKRKWQGKSEIDFYYFVGHYSNMKNIWSEAYLTI